jgi:hypothetical protein
VDLSACDTPEDEIGKAYAVGNGGQEPGTGTADVVASETDGADDGGGDNNGGREAVAEPGLFFSGVLALHFAHRTSIGEYKANVFRNCFALIRDTKLSPPFRNFRAGVATLPGETPSKYCTPGFRGLATGKRHVAK